MVQPQSVSAQGVFEVLESGLHGLGIQEVSAEQCKKLVSIGTDGASANIAGCGLKGLVGEQLPWVFWIWCIAHGLELVVKDALKGTAFDVIDKFLLRLYYLYEKSPKKCRELEEVIKDLRECLSFDDAGVKPVRSSGSRWVSHKCHEASHLKVWGVHKSHCYTV